MMFLVVPVEEPPEPLAGVFQAPEPLRVACTVLHRLELAFGVGIIVADVRTAVALRHPQIAQPLGQAPRAHCRPTIRVERELVSGNLIFFTGDLYQVCGEIFALHRGEQPPHYPAAEDIDHHIELVPDTFLRTPDLGDVPAPDLVGPHGQQLGLPIGGVAGDGPAFPQLALSGQQPLKRTKGA